MEVNFFPSLNDFYDYLELRSAIAMGGFIYTFDFYDLACLLPKYSTMDRADYGRVLSTTLMLRVG